MKNLLYLLICFAFTGFNSCSDSDDVQLPDITVNFTSTQVGLESDKASIDATVELSRAYQSAVEATVTLVGAGVTYGEQFTTTPEAVSNNLKITIPANSTLATFTITKKDEIFLEGTESVNFTITSLSTNNGIVIGTKKEMKLEFNAIVSTGQTLTLTGRSGDIAYANAVYVDFSSNTPTAISRKAWDLGFYCGNDDFRVVLNPAYATTVTASGKTDISTVTIEDANAAINIAASPMSTEGLPITVIDSYDGAITGTAFAAILENDADNKVYFVTSDDNKSSRDQWYKVKITRKSEGYSVQYAKVGETTINTIDISKKSAYNFAFLSLSDGAIVNAEPEAKKWDIVWSYGIALTSDKPYFMQDLVMVNNIGGAEASQIMVTDGLTYDTFGKTNLADATFSNSRSTIANNWRTTANMGGATGAIGIKTDRFYVVKDPAENYYKFRFVQMGLGNDGGTRGLPKVEYALIK